MSESSRHQSGHRDVDQGLGGLGELLIVLAEPAALAEPRQSALHHPPPGQDSPEPLGTEAVPVDDSTDGSPRSRGLAGMANDVHRPAQVGLDPLLAGPTVARIHPGMLEAREILADACEHHWKRGPVLDGGAMDLGPEHQSLGLDHEVTLALAELLAAVISPYASNSGCLDLLAVDDAGTGLGVSPNPDAQPFAKGSMHRLPDAIQSPEPEVVIDRLPGRELVGQQPPLTTTTDDIEDGIQDLPPGVGSWSAQPVDRWQIELDAGMLFTRQIGGIGLSGLAGGIGTSRSYPFSDRF